MSEEPMNRPRETQTEVMEGRMVTVSLWGWTESVPEVRVESTEPGQAAWKATRAPPRIANWRASARGTSVNWAPGRQGTFLRLPPAFLRAVSVQGALKGVVEVADLLSARMRSCVTCPDVSGPL